MSQSSSGNEADNNAKMNALVARHQRGDSKAFDEIWEPLEQRVLSYIKIIVNDHHLAEDIFQVIALKLHRSLLTIQLPLRSIAALWKRIARNFAIDCFRKKKVRKKKVNLNYFDVVPETAELTIDKSDAELLAEHLAWSASAFCNLDAREQEVLSMRYGSVNECVMTFQEIGDAIGVCSKTAKKIHDDALVKLRRQFNNDHC